MSESDILEVFGHDNSKHEGVLEEDNNSQSREMTQDDANAKLERNRELKQSAEPDDIDDNIDIDIDEVSQLQQDHPQTNGQHPLPQRNFDDSLEQVNHFQNILQSKARLDVLNDKNQIIIDSQIAQTRLIQKEDEYIIANDLIRENQGGIESIDKNHLNNKEIDSNGLIAKGEKQIRPELTYKEQSLKTESIKELQKLKTVHEESKDEISASLRGSIIPPQFNACITISEDTVESQLPKRQFELMNLDKLLSPQKKRELVYPRSIDQESFKVKGLIPKNSEDETPPLDQVKFKFNLDPVVNSSQFFNQKLKEGSEGERNENEPPDGDQNRGERDQEYIDEQSEMIASGYQTTLLQGTNEFGNANGPSSFQQTIQSIGRSQISQLSKLTNQKNPSQETKNQVEAIKKNAKRFTNLRESNVVGQEIPEELASNSKNTITKYMMDQLTLTEPRDLGNSMDNSLKQSSGSMVTIESKDVDGGVGQENLRQAVTEQIENSIRSKINTNSTENLNNMFSNNAKLLRLVIREELQNFLSTNANYLPKNDDKFKNNLYPVNSTRNIMVSHLNDQNKDTIIESEKHLQMDEINSIIDHSIEHHQNEITQQFNEAPKKEGSPLMLIQNQTQQVPQKSLKSMVNKVNSINRFISKPKGQQQLSDNAQLQQSKEQIELTECKIQPDCQIQPNESNEQPKIDIDHVQTDKNTIKSKQIGILQKSVNKINMMNRFNTKPNGQKLNESKDILDGDGRQAQNAGVIEDTSKQIGSSRDIKSKFFQNPSEEQIDNKTKDTLNTIINQMKPSPKTSQQLMKNAIAKHRALQQPLIINEEENYSDKYQAFKQNIIKEQAIPSYKQQPQLKSPQHNVQQSYTFMEDSVKMIGENDEVSFQLNRDQQQKDGVVGFQLNSTSSKGSNKNKQQQPNTNYQAMITNPPKKLAFMSRGGQISSNETLQNNLNILESTIFPNKYNDNQQSIDSMYQNNIYPYTNQPYPHQYNTQPSENQHNIASNSENLSEIWQKALEFQQRGQLNRAYQIILDIEDDVYLLRLMSKTGPCFGKLNQNVGRRLLRRINRVAESQFIDSMSLSLFSKCYEQDLFQELNLEDNQFIKEILYDISASSQLGQSAAQLYSLITKTDT